MVKATLTAERARELLDYDPETGVFRWKVSSSKKVKPGDVAGGRNTNGYLRVCVDGRLYQAHRLAWLMMQGRWPSLHIDHINGDKLDNRMCNLREATQAQNIQNASKHSDSLSGLKGVSFSKAHGKWVAQIMVNGTKINLGHFECPTTAHISYCKAAMQHFGEYARTA